MMLPSDDLERLWDDILSRDPEKVCKVYNSLNDDERVNIVTHLEKMVKEPGWLPEQRHSAKVALDTINQGNL